MTFRGYIKNGRIVFDEPVDLPEGTEVELRRAKRKSGRASKAPAKSSRARKPISKSERSSHGGRKTESTRYQGLVGLLNGLPADFSAQHDHYIHGTPKR
jgi:hypothetical protein